MHEWIARVMPLPVPATAADGSPARELARFRIRIVSPQSRPGGRTGGGGHDVVDVGPVRVIALDTANPSGGVGGSLSSEQARWLVTELERSRERYVVVATHDSSLTMTSDRVAPGEPPRVLGAETASLLLAHDCVVCWIAGTMHHRGGRRHGDPSSPGHGFWELPGSVDGRDSPLAGGVSLLRRDDRPTIVLQGALAAGHGPRWELGDPFGIDRPRIPEHLRDRPYDL